jgi:uncharacterized membrane protein (UPF0136 family)
MDAFKKIPGEAHPSYIMAGLVTMGGLQAYLKRGSKQSLISSLIFGAAYTYSAEQIRRGEVSENSISLGSS